MTNEEIKNLFNKHGFSDKTIDVLFGIIKFNLKYNEIDVIVEKHKILLHYKLTKTLLKFDNYHSNDFQLSRNVEIYIKAMKQAIEKLEWLSTSVGELYLLRLFKLTLDDERKYLIT